MMLGGSGDILAHALSRRGKDIGAVVYQIPSVALSEHRPGDKENDAQNLAELLRDSPALFYETSFQEREIIRLKQAFAERRDVMKSRVACEQRIFQRVIGQTFIREDGLYPEGEIDDIYKATKANSEVLKKLLKEENERNVELERMVSQLRVYQQLFEPIKGMGPRIASGLIVSIGDIRRFATDAKLKKRCGVHLLPDGRFPRKRRHEPADWQGEARQSLYLLGDQFNRHPETEWGKKLREYKVKLRQKHPQPIKVPKIDPETGEPVIHKKTGKPLMVSKYTDAHIHKMATWRTLTKFTEWLWREWWRLEKT
jgi:hypothetical protein